MAVAEKTRKKRAEIGRKSPEPRPKEGSTESFGVDHDPGMAKLIEEIDSLEVKPEESLTEEQRLKEARTKLGIAKDAESELYEEKFVPNNSGQSIEDLAIYEARKKIEQDKGGENGFLKRIWVRMAEGRYLRKYYDDALIEIESNFPSASDVLKKADKKIQQEQVQEVSESKVEASHGGDFFKRLKAIVGNIDYDKIVLSDEEKKQIGDMLFNFSTEDQKYFFSGDSKKKDIARLRKLTKAVLGEDPGGWWGFMKNKHVGAYGGAILLEFQSEDVLDEIAVTHPDLVQETRNLKKKIFTRNATDVFLAPNEQGGLLESVESLKVESGKGGQEAKQEADEKFRQILKSKIKNIAVHGTGSFGKKMKSVSDLDGEASLKFFELAGFEADVKYVDKGSFEKGVLNSDTGMYDGIAREGGTFYIDHHGKESNRDSSACKYTWQFLKEFGFFEGKSEQELKAIERMVEFITEIDNCNYDKYDYKSIFENSYRNLTGYVKTIKLDRLLSWFMNPQNESKSPYDNFSVEELGYLMGIDNPDELNGEIEKRKKIVEDTTQEYEKLRDEGFIVNSQEYGKIFVVNGEHHLNGGVDAAIALGAGAFVLWNPPSFMISFFSKQIKPEHEVALDDLINKGNTEPSTERIRRMYAKFPNPKNAKIKLRASIGDVLGVLTDADGAYTVEGDNGMKRLMIDERKQLKETKYLGKKS